MHAIRAFSQFSAVLLCSAASIAQITQSKPMPKVVEVHVDPGNLGTVPPRLFGTFIEPIDNSINNGVIAEILVNGSLEAGLWNHAMLEQIFSRPARVDRVIELHRHPHPLAATQPGRRKSL